MGKTKQRPGGLVERTRTYDGKRVHFYGRRVAEVNAKIAAYEEEQNAAKKGKKRKDGEKTQKPARVKKDKKKKFSETDIATMPVSDEEYVDDDKN